MSPPPENRFCRLLRGLDDDAFRAFLADLWSGQGWETRIEGEHVVATRADPDERVRLGIHRERTVDALRSTPEFDIGTTAVVTDGGRSRTVRAAAFDADARLVDAADLYGMVRHGVGAAAREDLLERHFGRAAVADDPTLRQRVGRGAAAARGRVPEVAGALGVLVLALLLVTAAAGGSALSALPLVGGPEAAHESGPGPAGATTPATTEARTATEEPEPEQLAPGLSSEGVTNATRLLSAHRSHLENRSYRRVVLRKADRTPQPAGGNWTRGFYWARQIEAVDDGTALVSRASVRTEENAAPGPSWTAVPAATAFYLNGTATFVRSRSPNETEYRTFRERVPLRRLSPGRGAPLETTLRGENSTVVGTTTRNGTTLYVLTVTSDRPTYGSADGIRGWTATFLVDSDGFVHEMRTVLATVVPVTESRRPLLSNSYVVRYTDVGDTTVTKPDWVDEAVASENGTTTAD